MAIKDRFTLEELLAFGYELVTKDRAKLKGKNSYRNRCKTCETWVKQTTNGQCKKCFIKSYREKNANNYC